MLLCNLPFDSHHTPTTTIYTLSLHDALPILRPRARTRDDVLPGRDRSGGRHPRPSEAAAACRPRAEDGEAADRLAFDGLRRDRKSSLNSSHSSISYAVFCLKKKKIIGIPNIF